MSGSKNTSVVVTAAAPPVTSEAPPDPRQVLRIVTASVAVETMVFSLVVPALPEFSRRYGLSDSAVSLIFAAFPISQLATACLIAERADDWGRRSVLLVGFGLLVVATVGFSLADDPVLLGAARAIQGVGAGLTWVGGIAAISDVYPQSELGYRLGLVELAGGGIGLVGPLVGGPMIEAFGTGTTFQIAAVIAAITLVGLRRMPETRSIEPQRLPLLATLRDLFSQSSARIGAVSLCMLGVVLAVVEPLLPLDLERRLGVSAVGVGLVFGAGLVAYLIATPLAGRWSDRSGRRRPIVAGGLAVACALPFCAIGPTYTVAAAFVVVGAGLATMGASSAPLLVDAVDRAGFKGHYGFSAAVLTGIFAFGYALGPLLGALGRTQIPFFVLTLIMSGSVLAVGAVIARRAADA